MEYSSYADIIITIVQPSTTSQSANHHHYYYHLQLQCKPLNSLCTITLWHINKHDFSHVLHSKCQLHTFWSNFTICNTSRNYKAIISPKLGVCKSNYFASKLLKVLINSKFSPPLTLMILKAWFIFDSTIYIDFTRILHRLENFKQDDNSSEVQHSIAIQMVWHWWGILRNAAVFILDVKKLSDNIIHTNIFLFPRCWFGCFSWDVF